MTEEVATCGACGHAGHGAVGSGPSDQHCNTLNCDCEEWSADVCLGRFSECKEGECQGRESGGHTPGCHDAAN